MVKPVVLIAMLAVSAVAVGGVLLPSMRLRNGLTDEQYDALFAAGKNPTIDANTARDWMYRAYRYENVKEWLDLIGKTNNFAALAAKLPVIQDELLAMSNLCSTVMHQNVNLERIINTKNEIIDDMSGRIEFVSAKIMESYADATNSAAKAILPTTREIYNGIAKLYLSFYDHLNAVDNVDPEP